MHTTEKRDKRFKRGFTLAEVLVVLFIFTVMITTMVGSFVTILHRHADAKKMQQQTEEFSLAASYISKKIRTSDIVTCPTGNLCKVLDHSASTPAANVYSNFVFNGGTLSETVRTNTLDANGNVTGTSAVTTPIVSNVTGGFTSANTAAGKIARVTLHMMAPGQTETSVQTTISLRSYQ